MKLYETFSYEAFLMKLFKISFKRQFMNLNAYIRRKGKKSMICFYLKKLKEKNEFQSK